MNYNPILENGVFIVSGFGKTKKISAADSANAKWKFCNQIGIDFSPEMLSCKTIKKTKRTN